ncbi:energy transducer TonB [Paraburkholderia antibiotica]|nr:energy transducer TonB [Paraburkholderia antibiotica]
MLQVAMASPASPTHHARVYRRAAFVLGAVIAAHLVLLAVALSARDRIVERPVEPRTITAVLLSPEPEPSTPAPAVARPAPVVPTPPAVTTAHLPPTPPAAHPATRVKPAPPPPRTQVARSVDTPSPLPTPSPTIAPATPPENTAAVPQPATPSTAATVAKPAASASIEPRNVAHVDCSIPKPDYPDISQRRGEHGTAVVRFVVGLTGKIETAQLQKSSGSTRLDDAALAAVHAGSCRPYTDNGTPVRAAYSQSFVFGLAE